LGAQEVARKTAASCWPRELAAAAAAPRTSGARSLVTNNRPDQVELWIVTGGRLGPRLEGRAGDANQVAPAGRGSASCARQERAAICVYKI